MATTTHIDTPNGVQFSRFAAWAQTTRERFSRYRAYRRTLKELSALNTRQLADLGLQRSAIDRVAYQAAYNGR